jgi:5'-phosphate synthase pdxT subunit
MTTKTFSGIFIRAPRFIEESIRCEKVATLENETVGVLQGSKLALTFHPELTNDRRFHRWLINEVIDDKS